MVEGSVGPSILKSIGKVEHLPIPDRSRSECPLGQLMPDEFKVVLARLFELARGKAVRPPSATIAAGSDAPIDESGEAGREGRKDEPAINSGDKNNADAQPVATEETSDPPTIGRDDDGQGSGAAMLFGEGETAVASETGPAPPDWLADPKTFVSRVLQWAEKASAKRSKLDRAKPPKRAFPL